MVNHVITPKFMLGERVCVDEGAGLVVTVTGFLWRGYQTQIECAWMFNGAAQSAWFDEWRLTQAIQTLDTTVLHPGTTAT